ncbi:MAG: hypothetical protein GY928_03775 [Colwellia sp.]|nr:hypothetical protein [Colwellia sp.]
MTLQDLLNKPLYRGNQSFLAKELGISRNTLTKYLTDTVGEKHIIRKQKGKYVLFGLLTKENK